MTTKHKVPTSVINTMPLTAVQELLAIMEAAPISIVKPPAAGLTMMHIRDAFDSEFLLGEVLCTTTEVALHDQRALGMVLGDEPERALARACAEVLQQGVDELLCSRMQKLLVREQKSLMEQHKQEAHLIAATKVHFDLMPGQ